MRTSLACRAAATFTLCAVPLLPVLAQYPSEDKPARSLLYGRRETASVDLSRIGTSSMDDLLPWRHRSPPLTAGTGTSARLWTDLPITIDTLRIPPGTYRIQLEAPRTLLVTAEASPGGEIGRVVMSEGPSGVNVQGWSLAVVTSRHGDDTLSVAEARVRGIDVTTIRHGPGTRSVLRLRYLDRELSAPIAAR